MNENKGHQENKASSSLMILPSFELMQIQLCLRESKVPDARLSDGFSANSESVWQKKKIREERRQASKPENSSRNYVYQRKDIL